MQAKFADYEEVIAYTDGSSIRNPGRVRNINSFFYLIIGRISSCFYGTEKKEG